MLIEVHLAEPRESLQVPVPESFRGARRDNEDSTLHITTQPAYFTADEIALIEAHIAKLTYDQSLVRTGAVLVGNNPLLAASAKQLDAIEKTGGLGSTKTLDDGSDRPLLDRALILIEQGFNGPIPEIAEPVAEVNSGNRNAKTSGKSAELAAV